MARTTEDYADTTSTVALSRVVDDALRALRIAGTVLLRESYSPPWAIEIAQGAQLAALLKVAPRVRVVAFHLVELGHCTLTTASGERQLLSAGELAICFGGGSHRLAQGEATESLSIESLLSGDRPRAGRSEPYRFEAHRSATAQSREEVGASLLCGVFLLQQAPFNPLLGALPAVMQAKLSRPGELHNLAGVARLMAEEIDRNALGGGYIVERLLEVLCAEAVRAHIESFSTPQPSWFRAIKDPLVGRAIAAIHLRPAEHWSVPRLAADVAMSPSRFAARFTAALGDSPIAYLTKWRMNLACRELSEGKQGIEQIAVEVGYDSAAAFSRTFKKHIGVTPAAWRANAASEKA